MFLIINKHYFSTLIIHQLFFIIAEFFVTFEVGMNCYRIYYIDLFIL